MKLSHVIPLTILSATLVACGADDKQEAVSTPETANVNNMEVTPKNQAAAEIETGIETNIETDIVTETATQQLELTADALKAEAQAKLDSIAAEAENEAEQAMEETQTEANEKIDDATNDMMNKLYK